MTRAPLRISFFGGGTDYPEYFQNSSGAVLASAIDKYSYVTASPFPSRLFDYRIRLSYRKVELVKHLDEIEHAIYRECLRFCGIDGDIELHNVADLPAFSGLGSSSTFTISLLQVLHAFKGEIVKGIQLAYEAIHIERKVLKECVGCQDQTLAAVGGFNLIEFKSEDDIRVNKVPLSLSRLQELESHLLLFFTTITRRASDVAADQIRNLSENQAHLTKMRAMVDQGYDILTGGTSISHFGELLHTGWMLKRQLAQSVTNSRIDQMYSTAREYGAIGGKLLGAGGGGFLLVFAPPERHNKIRAAFSQDQEVKVKLNAPGSEIML